MLDMGFIHDIKKVLAIIPAKKQSLLFSATFSDEIKALADRLLNQPVLIEVARRNSTAELVEQKVHPVPRERKKELLAHLIRKGDWHQVLVFTRMKHGANRLTDYLNDQKISAMAIHGNKSQTARTKALADFKRGELQVLVATDIAARGIDIDQLPHVVNYELPNVPEDYVHRIGRTGRAGASGEAISLVCVDEEIFLRDIERLTKRSIPREVVSGFEPDPNEKAEPIVLGRMTIGIGGTRRNSGGGGGGGRSASPRGGSGGGGGDRRTGRAGASGEAISLACLDEEVFLKDIERLIKRSIPREVVPGFEPDPNEKAEPIVLGRMTIGVGGTRRNSGGGGGGRGASPRGGSGGGGDRRAGGGGGGASSGRSSPAAPRRDNGAAARPSGGGYGGGRGRSGR
jgi:ATP-dependent RNA helicase RhlE